MDIRSFATERYFDLYEFSCPYLLSASDCETMTIAELVERAGASLDELGRLTLGYAEVRGTPELRAGVAAACDTVEAEHVVALAAPEEGIYVTMRALLEPGDAVVVLTPCYDSLANVAEHMGCAVHRWALTPTATGWALDLDALARLLDSCSPRLVVVNFPHNPTGFLASHDEFRALSAMVEASGAWLFCDEMYRGLELEPASRLPCAADVHERCVVLGGLSKTHGLPGLRAGWLIIRDVELRERIVNWKYYTTICATTPSIWLATLALKIAPELRARSVATISRNLALAEEFFAERSERFVWRPPVAGSIALVETSHADVEDHCRALADSDGVMLLPGACVGAPPQFVRFGFGRVNFAEGLAAYARALARAEG